MGKKIACPDCKGTGLKETTDPCEMCGGGGKVELIDDYGQRRTVKCFPCRGTGKIHDTDTCNMCGGEGEIEV